MTFNNIFSEEMEVLQAIYEDELIVKESEDGTSAEARITIHPNTADDKDGKYVCLTLHCFFTFSVEPVRSYPHKEPHIYIKNPRGLSDSHLASIEENLRSLSVRLSGEQMLFSLIEYAKESLTDNNHPSCDCPICLEKFEEGGVFFRTACYHYFHLRCIQMYIKYSGKMSCPVCRLEYQIDESLLKSEEVCKGQESAIEAFVPDKEYLEWRNNLESLYQKQKLKGGIIDPEVEKNKYLITLADIRTGENEPVHSTSEIGIVHTANTSNFQNFPSGNELNDEKSVGSSHPELKVEYFDNALYTPPQSPKQKMKYDVNRKTADSISRKLESVHLHGGKEAKSNEIPNSSRESVSIDSENKKFVDHNTDYHSHNAPLRQNDIKESRINDPKARGRSSYYLRNHSVTDKPSSTTKLVGDSCTIRGRPSTTGRRYERPSTTGRRYERPRNYNEPRNTHHHSEYNYHNDKYRNNGQSYHNSKLGDSYGKNVKDIDRYPPKYNQRKTQHSKGRFKMENDNISIPGKDIHNGKDCNDVDNNTTSDKKLNHVLDGESGIDHREKLDEGNSSSDRTISKGQDETNKSKPQKRYVDKSSARRTRDQQGCYSDDSDYRNFNKYRPRRPPPGFAEGTTKKKISCQNILAKDHSNSSISLGTNDSASCVPLYFEKRDNEKGNSEIVINENKSKYSEFSNKDSEKKRDTIHPKMPPGLFKNERK